MVKMRDLLNDNAVMYWSNRSLLDSSSMSSSVDYTPTLSSSEPWTSVPPSLSPIQCDPSFVDVCVLLGLRPANESFCFPLLPSTNTTTAACPVGDRAQTVEHPKEISQLFCVAPVPSLPTWEVGLKVFFYACSMLLALVGNLLVVVVVVTSKRMRSRTNVFILNLALMDLLAPLTCMMPHLGNGITTGYPFPAIICRMSVFMQVLTVTSGVFFLTLIAVDRFFSVVFPMKLGITPPVLTVVLVTTWTCAVAVASPLPFFTERQEMFWYNHNEVWCADRWPAFFYQTEGVSPHCLTWNPGKRAYYTVYIVCMYFIPILTMVGVYGAILWTLWTRPKDQGATVDAMHQRTRRKVVRMLAILFVTFVVCYTPMQSLLLYDVYRPQGQRVPSWYNPVMYAATYLAYTNSAINPVLYAGLNSNFRRGFVALLRCRRCRPHHKVAPSSGDGRPTLQRTTPGVAPTSHNQVGTEARPNPVGRVFTLTSHLAPSKNGLQLTPPDTPDRRIYH